MCSTETVDNIVESLKPRFTEIENEITIKGLSLYGCGLIGEWAYKYFTSEGFKINNVFDGNPSKCGMPFGNHNIEKPDTKDLIKCPVLITPRSAVNEISSFLDKMNSEIIYFSFDAYFVVKYYDRISNVRDNLSDSRSQVIYNSILKSILSGKIDVSENVFDMNSYFSILPEFSCKFSSEIYVDCGAYVGDTIEQFITASFGNFEHIYAFEPGDRQYGAMQYRLERLSKEYAFDLSKVSIEKAALSSHSGFASGDFNIDCMAHNRISVDCSSNGDIVKIYSLDDYLKGKKVTLIKADVEGAELDILKGAVKTITTYKPKLAFCIYHHPEDLFAIYEYIHNLVPEYKFSVRWHSYTLSEYVLYAYL